jgi:hypothetical protein
MKKYIVVSLIIIFFFIIYLIRLFLPYFWSGDIQDLSKELNFPQTEKISTWNISENLSFLKFAVPNKYAKQPIYVGIENTGNDTASIYPVINNLNWSNPFEIIKNYLNPSQSDEQKAIMLYGFVTKNTVHSEPPMLGAFMKEKSLTQMLSTWGYGFCSDLARTLAQLSVVAGLDSRVVYLDEHVVTEIFYNNKWHMFDPDRKAYYIAKDGTIANVGEIMSDLTLLKQNYPFIYDIQYKAFSSKNLNYYGGLNDIRASIIKYYENIEYKLSPGSEIRFYSNWKGLYYYRDNTQTPAEYTNGLLISKNVYQYSWTDVVDKKFYFLKKYVRSVLKLMKLFTFRDYTYENTFRIDLPHPILNAYILPSTDCSIDEKYLISLDGVQWQQAGKCSKQPLDLIKFFKIGINSEITYSYYIKTYGYKPRVNVLTVFQFSHFAIPVLNKNNTIIFWPWNNQPLKFTLGL